MKKIIIYKSKTGFTEKYAKLISKKINCDIINLEDVNKINLNEYELVIFGSRLIAGKIDSWIKVKKIFQENNIKEIVLFTTGATPNEAISIIDEMWEKNLGNDLKVIPHFYMQSGMCLEKLPFKEKMMIKIANFIMKRKNKKDDTEKELEDAISKSFDISDEQFIKPLIEYLKK